MSQTHTHHHTQLIAVFYTFFQFNYTKQKIKFLSLNLFSLTQKVQSLVEYSEGTGEDKMPLVKKKKNCAKKQRNFSKLVFIWFCWVVFLEILFLFRSFHRILFICSFVLISSSKRHLNIFIFEPKSECTFQKLLHKIYSCARPSHIDVTFIFYI